MKISLFKMLAVVMLVVCSITALMLLGVININYYFTTGSFFYAAAIIFYYAFFARNKEMPD